ncbi:MAG TPA: RNA ligase family protein [Fluviicoccus sp.]|nr:RNA ligase family protein [Fluviicoccus sp.]
MNDFFRFPHTPHIAWLGADSPRDDKVLTPVEIEALLAGPVTLEEKLDGANLGISVGENGELRAQNRGHYLERPFPGQFEKLEMWLRRYEDVLFDALGENLILFGEWCAARHSLDYTGLPGWFVGFDVYDRQREAFWSTRRRNALLAQLELPAIRCIGEGQYTLEQLKELVMHSGSQYRDGVLEGIVIRHQDEDWLLNRAKLVRHDFTQAIQEHWRKRRIEWNDLAGGYGGPQG